MKISPSKIRARLQTRDISRALRCVWIFFLRVLKVGEFVLDFPSLFFFVCACDVEKKDILLVCFGVDLKKQTNNNQKNNRRERENVRRARERETNSRNSFNARKHARKHTQKLNIRLL